VLPVTPVPGSTQLVDRDRFAGANIDARATVATGFRIDGCDLFHQLDGVQRAGINALGTSGALLSVHNRCHQTGLPFQNSQNLNSQTTHSVLYTQDSRRPYLKPSRNDHPRLGGREATASGASVGGKRGQVILCRNGLERAEHKIPFSRRNVIQHRMPPPLREVEISKIRPSFSRNFPRGTST